MNPRSLLSITSIALLAATATSQCGSLVGGNVVNLIPTGSFPAADEGLSAPLPLGFSFPMGGTTYSHIQIESNGVIYLTNGSTAAGTTQFGSPDFVGVGGSAPRIAPWWGDLDGSVSPTSQVTFAQVSPDEAEVRWIDVNEYLEFTAKSFCAVLFSTGEIEFSYSSGLLQEGPMAAAGISEANGSANPGSVDLSTGAIATGSTLYEFFVGAGACDLGGTTLRFTPTGASGYTVHTSCTSAGSAASHVSNGSGCYAVSDSLYEIFPDAATASASLTGQSLLLSFTGSSYLATWGGGTYVAPTGAASALALGDDDEVTITPSLGFPTPQGVQSTIRVHANGLLSWGGAAQTFPGTNNYEPTAAGMLGAANAGVWSWHDYNTTEPGSGQVMTEELGGVLYVTWDGVESYSEPYGSNPSSLQFQIDLSSGAIVIAWANLSSDATSLFGSAHLIGYSPGGQSVNTGSTSLSAVLPLLIPDANSSPLRLTASPLPISTSSTGSVVDYTMHDVPMIAPASGLHVGMLALSFGAIPGGIDLGFLGASGCNFYLQSLDLTFAVLSPTSDLTTTLLLPAGVPSGLQLFTQGIALSPAANALGMTTSNSITSTIGTH